MIALDAGDIDTYTNLFAPDAELYWIGGVERGREDIHKKPRRLRHRPPEAAQGRDRAAALHPRPGQPADRLHRAQHRPRRRHVARLQQPHAGQDSFETAEFGHYEDKYVKISGRWYFQERRIFNERLSNKALFYPELGEPDPREL